MTTNGNEPAFPRPPFRYVDDGCEWEAEAQQGLTARMLAAIELCVPNSGKPWLDDMIREALRDRMAGQIAAALYSGGANPAYYNTTAKMAFEAADALLAAKEGK